MGAEAGHICPPRPTSASPSCFSEAVFCSSMKLSLCVPACSVSVCCCAQCALQGAKHFYKPAAAAAADRLRPTEEQVAHFGPAGWKLAEVSRCKLGPGDDLQKSGCGIDPLWVYLPAPSGLHLN